MTSPMYNLSIPKKTKVVGMPEMLASNTQLGSICCLPNGGIFKKE